MKTYPNIINMTGTDLDILKASYADLIEESIKKKKFFSRPTNNVSFLLASILQVN